MQRSDPTRRPGRTAVLAAATATAIVLAVAPACDTSTDGYDIVHWCQAVSDTAPRAAQITGRPAAPPTARALLVPQTFTGADPLVIAANAEELNKILRIQSGSSPPRLKAFYAVLIDNVEHSEKWSEPKTQARIAEAEDKIAIQAKLHCKPGGVQERQR